MAIEKKASVLLVEDEENLHEALKLNLELEGYDVTSAFDGTAALRAVQAEYFDLIILDVMLPEMDGINVTETIRISNNEVPILILSAKNSSADRVLGLKKGADDYLTKPFAVAELLARLRALLRRGRVVRPATITIADLVLDTGAQRATRNGKTLALTTKEYALLEYLAHQQRAIQVGHGRIPAPCDEWCYVVRRVDRAARGAGRAATKAPVRRAAGEARRAVADVQRSTSGVPWLRLAD